jgi:hypothetical protein
VRVFYGASWATVVGGIVSALGLMALGLLAARGSRLWRARLPAPASVRGAA